MPEPTRVAIVAAQNEEETVGEALAGLKEALPGARLIVADDASRDGTKEVAMRHGGWVIGRGRAHGKGGNVGAAAQAAIGEFPDDATVLLCDADLGRTAAELGPLVDSVEGGGCDLAIGGFSERRGGGMGLAIGYSRRAVGRLTGERVQNPLSGQRAMRIGSLRLLQPFAAGWGIETGMTIDAIRHGLRVEEIELPLTHRATGRTPAGFLHRGRQLRDIRRAVRSRSR